MEDGSTNAAQLIELVGLVGLAVFVFASLVVGVRILMLAIRLREFPETTIGLSLLLAGGIGTALSIIPPLFSGTSEHFQYLCNVTSLVANHLGFALLFLFVWRVFRPRDLWGALLFGTCSIALAIGGLGSALSLQLGDQLVGPLATGDLWFWISIGSRFVGYGWATFESFRYYAMLRRRVEIGLAQTDMVSRFFYWGVCTAAVELIWVAAAAQRIASPQSMIQPWVSVVSALMGFVVAGSLWQAFFPRSNGPRVPSTPAQDPTRSAASSS